MMLMRFPTLGSLYTAATYNEDKTQRREMQTSTNLNRLTNLNIRNLFYLNTWDGNVQLLLFLAKLHRV